MITIVSKCCQNCQYLKSELEVNRQAEDETVYTMKYTCTKDNSVLDLSIGICDNYREREPLDYTVATASTINLEDN